MSDTILVLHSGGLDSTTCLYAAKEAGHDAISLGVNYSTRAGIELAFAEDQCRKLGIRRDVINIKWEKPERAIPTERTIAQMVNDPSPAFLPGRNALFLSLALAHSAGVGANRIQIGINCVDFSNYPDCTQQFLYAFGALAKEAYPSGPMIEAPLLNMSKREIAVRAKSLGIRPGETWSCYKPTFVAGHITPCGKCDACRLHEHAWDGL